MNIGRRSPYVYTIDQNGDVTGRRNTVTGEYEEGSSFPREHGVMPENAGFYDILEIYEKAKEAGELAGAAGPDLPVMPDLRSLDWLGKYEPSGNADLDRLVYHQFRFQAACFDFEGDDEAFRAAFAHELFDVKENYAGMSETEKYLAVYDRFRSVWGEDFMDAGAIESIYSGRGSKYKSVMDLFISRAGGSSPEESRDIRREALYPDMTDGEVQKAIIEKYRAKAEGSLTNADLCKMANEMYNCGVDYGLRGFMFYCTDCEVSLKPGNGNDPVAAREHWLNTKVTGSTMQRIKGLYGGMIQNCTAPSDPRLGYMVELLCSETLKRSYEL